MSRTQRRQRARERLAAAERREARGPEKAPAAAGAGQPFTWRYPKMSRQALIMRLLMTALGIGYIAKVVHDGVAAQHR